MNVRSRTITVIALAALISGLGVASIAVATPGSGTVVTSDLFSGPLDGTKHGPAIVEQDGIALKTETRTSVATFDLTYPPGSFSGWHSHPGIVIVVVKSGTVVRQTGCDTEKFKTGESFTEVGPHYVSNPTKKDAVLSITRIYLTHAVDARIDEPAPVCR